MAEIPPQGNEAEPNRDRPSRNRTSTTPSLCWRLGSRKPLAGLCCRIRRFSNCWAYRWPGRSTRLGRYLGFHRPQPKRVNIGGRTGAILSLEIPGFAPRPPVVMASSWPPPPLNLVEFVGSATRPPGATHLEESIALSQRAMPTRGIETRTPRAVRSRGFARHRSCRGKEWRFRAGCCRHSSARINF